jgi:N-acetylglutamate synthase
VQPSSTSLIHTLEILAANAWPAAEAQTLDGWRLRFTAGVTRRANSVWPNDDGGELDLAEKMAQVESFYAARTLPTRYQISPATQPQELDDLLATQGYAALARTAVQVADLATILQQTKPLRAYPSFEVEVSEEFDEDWFATFCAAERGDEPANDTLRAIFQRIQPPSGFVLLRVDGALAAVGLGVLEAGWLGIFCMATQEPFRRQGAASAILRTLAIWAQLYEATRAYLQVMDQNTPARRLYERLGFTTLYHYHYREKGVGGGE